jgi:pyruvate dehydrogenase E2 component (dihydrolipoamide acetyltransferase)
MPTNVIMPALGVAQKTGTLLKWLKAEGQSVSKGEPLMEIETDKATVEIEAPASGVLSQVIAKAGDEIPVGQRIALILAPGESASAAAVQSPHPRIESGAGSCPPKSEGTTRETLSIGGTVEASSPPLPQGRGEGQTPTRSAKPLGASITGRILASPAAKRIAREKGINLGAIEGSGPYGSVLAADVLRVAPDGTAAALAQPTNEQIIPLSPMRRIVGERMTQSKLAAPHFYISMEIDMSAIRKLRTEWRQRDDEKIPSSNDFILLACTRALKEFPLVNASYAGQGIKFNRNINIGMAVALEEGLVVPIIRNADQLSLMELAARSRDLIDKAQKKKLFPLDYDGGSFTVSNLGMFGVDSFVAIINPPQCAILATGRVASRVVVEEEMLAIKYVMTATLSADHRVIDGAVGARFLRRIKQLLEDAPV